MQHAPVQTDLEDTKFKIYYRTKSTQDLFLKKLDHYQWANLKSVLDTTVENFASQPFSGDVFEIIAHKLIPTLSGQTLYSMTKEIQIQPKKKQKRDGQKRLERYLSVEESPETIEAVNFVRRTSVDFTDSVPAAIGPNSYYRGCKTTPLIDSFLLCQTDTGVILYLMRIITSLKKDKISLDKGAELVVNILGKVKTQFNCAVTVCFVLIGPASDIGLESNPTWKLPDSGTIGSDYKVYQCDIQIPNILPQG